MKSKCPRCNRPVRVSQRFANESQKGRIVWHRNPLRSLGEKGQWCPGSAKFVSKEA